MVRSAVMLLIGLQLLLVLVVVTAVYLQSNHARKTILNYTESHVVAQARNTEGLLTQSFNLLRQHLMSLQVPDSLSNDWAGTDGQAGLVDVSLNDLLNKLAYVRSLSILDKQGGIVFSTNRDNLGITLDLTGFLPVAAHKMIHALRFDSPWEGRDFSSGSQVNFTQSEDTLDSGFFPVAMLLPGESGWTVVANINSNYFINYNSSSAVVSGLEFKAYLDSGYLMFSTDAADRLGSKVDIKGFTYSTAAQEHDYQGISDEHLLALRASHAYPWFIQSQVPVHHVLQPWRKGAVEQQLLVALAMLLVLLVTGYMTKRMYSLLVNEEALYKKTIQAASVFAHSSDGITITDADMRIVTVNPAFEKITGFSKTEVVGKTPQILSSKTHDESFYKRMWNEINNKGVWQGEIVDRHKNGTLLTFVLTVNAIEDSATGGDKFYVGVFKDISSGRENEMMIRRLSQAIEQNPTSIVITDLKGSIEYANSEFYRSTGYDKQEIVGENPKMLASGLTPPSSYKALWAALTSGKSWQGELHNKRKDGSIYIERALMSPLTDKDGKVTNYLGIKYDVTREKLTDRELRLSASVMENTLDGVTICDADQKIIDINPAFTQITGYTRDEVLGKTPKILSSGRHSGDFYAAMWQSLDEQGHWQGEFWNRKKDGSLYAALSNVTIVRGEDGEISHYINVFADITELKNHQKNLELLAHYDLLTRLPNRALLHDRLQVEIARSKREGNWLAVCFMDLDGFKAVNDTHGHEAGDELLVTIARRLEKAVRSGDTVARLGGDEFVMLLGGIQTIRQYEQAANRILEAVAQPVPLSGHIVFVTGSMGITIHPQDGSESEQLLRHADHAMYQAKQAGRNRFVVYDPASDIATQRLVQYRNELTAALENDELQLYFQPKFDMGLCRVVGFEVLLRWQHPARGLLAPDQFLPQAAECNLSQEIDRWVIQQTFTQIRQWQESGVDIGMVNINISAALINDEGFIPLLQALLLEFPLLQASQVEFEVLESSAITSLSNTHDTLRSVRNLGFRLAIDDFGTGYSSLAWLRHLPINTLKIDQSFVRNMLVNRNDLSIVESVIRLARAFKHDLVAEGVETLAHAEVLLGLGCNIMQGYCISEPMPAPMVSTWQREFKIDAICSPQDVVDRYTSAPSIAAVIMQHRMWVNDFELLLAGEPEDPDYPLRLEADRCAFSEWYRWAKNQPKIAGQLQFDLLEKQHDQLHEIAHDLATAIRGGEKMRANQLMQRLYTQQSSILSILNSIQASSRADLN